MIASEMTSLWRTAERSALEPLLERVDLRLQTFDSRPEILDVGTEGVPRLRGAKLSEAPLDPIQSLLKRGEARLDPIQPLLKFGEAGLDPVQPLVDRIQALLDLTEPLVKTLDGSDEVAVLRLQPSEAGLDGLVLVLEPAETVIEPVELGSDFIEARIHLRLERFEPAIDSGEMREQPLLEIREYSVGDRLVRHGRHATPFDRPLDQQRRPGIPTKGRRGERPASFEITAKLGDARSVSRDGDMKMGTGRRVAVPATPAEAVEVTEAAPASEVIS
jgi:hypothetical protein